jgi:predicted acyl esterase
MVAGNGYIEDPLAMGKAYPQFNAYWADKIPKFSNIRIPTFYTSCWNHFHDVGSFEGFMAIKSRNKWMRAHREFEWPDTYNIYNIKELKDFFDRYLKDIRNGFEFVPKVRLEVMDAYNFDYQTNRPEKEFPLARTEYKKLYLNAADMSMSSAPVATEARVPYDGNTDIVTFDYVVPEETEITGYMSVHLNVSVNGYDDADLFFTVKKLGEGGKEVPVSVLNEPHPGAWCKLRLSMRKLSPKSKPEKPVQAFDEVQKLRPDEIVPIDVCFVPYSRIWHKGEKLRLQIAGRYIREPGWFERLGWETDNQGTQVIHTGGEFSSWLQIPFIPPRYKSFDYTMR